jgi:hypothetical protein
MNSLHFKWIIVKILLDWDQLLAILNFQLPVSWKVVGTFYSFCLFFCFLFFYVSYGFPLVTLITFFSYRNRCLDLLSFICLSELLEIWNSRVQINLGCPAIDSDKWILYNNYLSELLEIWNSRVQINFRLSGHWPRQVNFIQQLAVWITRNLKLTCPNKF